MSPLTIAAIVVVILLVWAVSVYNRLVSLRNRYRNGYAQIDVQLKRRHDLIPNLVDVAKGYLVHERRTLEAVVVARNSAVAASENGMQAAGEAASIQRVSAAEMGLSGALSRFFALSESYPDLKANETMMQLSEELSSTENRIAFARQAYNDGVMSYNTRVESFPDNVLSRVFSFDSAALFALENPSAESMTPSVSFS